MGSVISGAGVFCKYGRQKCKEDRKYIRRQLQEDTTAGQISLKEYRDPFTGELGDKGKNKTAP